MSPDLHTCAVVQHTLIVDFFKKSLTLLLSFLLFRTFLKVLVLPADSPRHSHRSPDTEITSVSSVCSNQILYLLLSCVFSVLLEVTEV